MILDSLGRANGETQEAVNVNMPPSLNIQIESKEWASGRSWYNTGVLLTNRHEFGRDRAFNFATSCNLHSIFWHSIFLLDFCIQFLLTWTRPGVYLVVYLDISWCLPGLEPGRKKTFNFEGTKTFNLWNGRLTSDPEGSKSQKTIQFPADPGVFQVFAWSCPGVSRQKKGGRSLQG